MVRLRFKLKSNSQGLMQFLLRQIINISLLSFLIEHKSPEDVSKIPCHMHADLGLIRGCLLDARGYISLPVS